MIPANITKIEKRKEVAEIIEKLCEYWYSNNEIWKLLWQHKNRISGLKTNKWEYPISLKKLEPILQKANKILSSLKTD